MLKLNRNTWDALYVLRCAIQPCLQFVEPNINHPLLTHSSTRNICTRALVNAPSAWSPPLVAPGSTKCFQNQGNGEQGTSRSHTRNNKSRPVSMQSLTTPPVPTPLAVAQIHSTRGARCSCWWLGRRSCSVCLLGGPWDPRTALTLSRSPSVLTCASAISFMQQTAVDLSHCTQVRACAAWLQAAPGDSPTVMHTGTGVLHLAASQKRVAAFCTAHTGGV